LSAIAVVLDLRGEPVTEAQFGRVFRAMDARGPDGRGTWLSGPVGLGHQALALAPEEVGAIQPAIVGDHVGVFDGRLDNREVLIRELCTSEPQPELVTDAELVVRAYDHWGDACAESLLGDFAFAVWDRVRNRLFCARDQLGARPLYYWENGTTLVIATDICGVLAHPDLVREPNERHIPEAVLRELSNNEDTLFRGVVRLPAAHALTADRKVVTGRYWDADLYRELTYSDHRDYLDHFLALFSDAIRCRLRTTCDSTIALSGGLDSSLVAAIGTDEVRSMRATTPRFTATSLVYPGADCDETEWIDAITGDLALESRRIPWAPMTWEHMIDEARRTMYTPSNPNATLDMFVRSGMRRTAVVTGAGGDQWMNGSDGHFRDLRAQRRYREIWTNVRQGGGRRLVRATVTGRSAHTLSKIQDARSRFRTEVVEPRWFGPKLTGFTPAEDVSLGQPPDDIPYARRQRYVTLHGTWDSHVVELADRAVSGGHLVSSRPFYDRRVVDFACALPDSERWRGADRRWFEREALRRLGCARTANRTTKAEFSAPYPLQLDALPVGDLLSDLRVVEFGWVSQPGIEASVTEFRSRTADSDTIRDIWAILGLEAWARAAWD
jgi:asparagine synthase (glutamine-hydrolysing)